MKTKNEPLLNVKAFGFASAAVGFVLIFFMSGMMPGYAIGFGGGMMNYGFQSGNVAPWMGIWMAIILGIIGALFALAYNVLLEK